MKLSFVPIISEQRATWKYCFRLRAAIAASRTPPWLLSGWGCRGGVFPEGEEILIGFSGFRRVASEHGAARQPQVGKRVELSPIGVLPRTAPIGALVIQDLFELSRCLSAFTQTQVSQRPGSSALARLGAS
jgi:hypothetical protein